MPNWNRKEPNSRLESHMMWLIDGGGHLRSLWTVLEGSFQARVVFRPVWCSGCFKLGFDTIAMGVGKMFLHGWNRLEMAVPYGFNGFCSIPRSWGEKMGFVLKTWWFRALQAASKTKWKKFCSQNATWDFLQTRFWWLSLVNEHPQKVSCRTT